MNNNATLAKKGEIASATLLNDSTTDVSAIENSWARCREVGLAPSGKPIDAVTSDIDLSIIQEKNQKIRQFVLPELQLLYNQIAGTNFMVAYADTSGVVLDAYLDEEFKRFIIAEKGTENISPKCCLLNKFKPLSMIFAFMFAPSINPCSSTAKSAALVVERYSWRAWNTNIKESLNCSMKSLFSTFLLASFTRANVCC